MPCAVLACSAASFSTSSSFAPRATKLHPGMRSPHFSCLAIVSSLRRGGQVSASVSPNATECCDRSSSLDHLVGLDGYGARDGKAECPRGFPVDHELERRGLLHGEIGRARTLEDAVDEIRGAPVDIR